MSEVDHPVMLGEAFDWMAEAACVDKPGRWWFPEPEDLPYSQNFGEGRSATNTYLEDFVPASAAAVCRLCEVSQDCLSWALAHEDQGVWAGTSPKQRRRMRKQAGIRCVVPTVRVRGRVITDEPPDPFEEIA